MIRSFQSLTLLVALVIPGHAGELPVGHPGAADYGDWTATGTAFRNGPASGDLLAKLEIENAGDAAVISSEIEDDGPQGTLTSPEFVISKPFISFRIGGGDYEKHACLNLLIDGKVVKSATGRNTDKLAPDAWDVRSWQGMSARIEAVDRASGRWGHINVSRIVQTDEPERAPLDKGLLYHEALRPQFHLTARQWTMDRLEPGKRQEGWINDLNGMIWYEGEYHLFAQRWHKCWLHFVSRDLVHWTELEPAFTEEKLDDGIQSGTCVIDYRNTSGLSPDPKTPAMVAFWTHADSHSHGISYSLDHGRTWKFYGKNPVLDFPERDPKVFWYEPGKHWVMVLYGRGSYHIFTSPDLLRWEDGKHPVPRSYECPDLFEMAVDGDAGRKKWVLIQGNGQYGVGSFDGMEYKEEGERHACDVGPNFYATQTFNNVETGDGRRIQCAWMRGSSFPGMPFNQQISFPCELTLRSTAEGLRIFRKPVREIESLHGRKVEWDERQLRAEEKLALPVDGGLFHIKAEVSIPEASTLVFDFGGEKMEVGSGMLWPGYGEPVKIAGEAKTIELLVDRASIETFLNEGETSYTRHAKPHGSGVSIMAGCGPATLHKLAIWELKPAWPDEPAR